MYLAKGRTLAVQAMEARAGRWRGVAIETISDAESVEDVFDQHNHKVLGDKEVSLPDAIALCESYAKEWLEGRGEPFEDCDCEEIDIEPRAIEPLDVGEKG